MRITFRVVGGSSKELEEAAEKILDSFVDSKVPSYRFEIEAEPEVMDGPGAVRLWSGEVTAETEGH